MKGIKAKNVVVCEHIIEGKNNKHTLINTMAGDILVENFPANIPIAFYIELMSQEAGILAVDIKIMLGRKQIAGGEAEVPFKKNESAILALPTALLKVDAPTTLKVVLQWDGAKPVTLVTKTFSQGPVSSNA